MLPKQVNTQGIAKQDTQTVDFVNTPNQRISTTSGTDHLVPYIFPGYDPFQRGVTNALRKLVALSDWPDGWNGSDALAPNKRAIRDAYYWLMNLNTYYAQSTAKPSWADPAVSALANGEVALEWWQDGKTLTIIFDGESSRYVRSWGLDIWDEMDDGDLSSISLGELWNWLIA